MFEFRDLDERTRRYMVTEIESGRHNGHLYLSKRFNAEGERRWCDLLLEAATEHNEHWLAFQLEALKLMSIFETAATPSGGYTTKFVPHNASETMAEGQFNRYYMLGLGRRALDDGVTALTVYRAKSRGEPREESQALIGTVFQPDKLIEQLKTVENSLKSPLLRPNGGLSVHL